MEWIKSSEKLPEKGERVLVYSIYGIQIGWLTVNNDWQFCNDGHQFTVEHWMPLPKLPCEGKADSTSEKDLRVCEVIPRFFDPERNKPLPSKNDITFSDDVFIIDEDGMHGLAYYSFEDCQWKFHTDTLVDYNEVGHETKWKWYYPTVTVEDAF